MAVLGKGKTIVQDFYEKVKKYTTNEIVEEELIRLVSSRETAKRSLALAQLLELISKQELEIRKIKPEERYAEDGSVIDVSFTKVQKDNLHKAKEKLDKMIKIFEKGTNGDMSDVYNLTQNKSGGGEKSSGEAD